MLLDTVLQDLRSSRSGIGVADNGDAITPCLTNPHPAVWPYLAKAWILGILSIVHVSREKRLISTMNGRAEPDLFFFW